MKRLLIVTKTSPERDLLAKKLAETHYAADAVETFEECVARMSKEHIDLIMIDWTLVEPHISTFAITIKKGIKPIALIAFSKVSDKQTHIEALNRGADDYSVYPYEGGTISPSQFALLLARIEARLRFGGTNVIDVGELLIDPDEEKIYYKTQEIELKGKPFEVLTHLARHRDQIISKEQLLDAIWEEPELVTPNVIEVAINQIRQKMDKPLGINTIETVRRRGNRFCFPNCSGQTILDR